MNKKDYDVLFFATPEEWEAWLMKEHATTSGIWVKIAKKASGIQSIDYQAALRVALCYGWIDGQAKSIDETYYVQKFTPRGPRSIWSKRNKALIAELITSGKMTAAGLQKVDEAKADGRWDQAYDSPKNTVIPEDFLHELSKHKKAYEFFKTLNKTNTYAITWRLQTAKKPETRARRMQAIITMLADEKKFH